MFCFLAFFLPATIYSNPYALKNFTAIFFSFGCKSSWNYLNIVCYIYKNLIVAL